MYTLPHPLRLRNAADSDAAFFRALYAATRDDLRQLPLPPAQLEQLIAMQQQVHEDGRCHVFPAADVLILEYDGAPAGRLVVDASGPAWRLVELAVTPALRGRGLARALLQALQQRAGAQGASIGLSVARTNAAALRLYDSAGFTVTGSADVQAHPLQHEMLWRPA
jgi:GNAT superfamily N-acetyltransferase